MIELLRFVCSVRYPVKVKDKMNELELLHSASAYFSNGDLKAAVRLLNKHGKQDLSLTIS